MSAPADRGAGTVLVLAVVTVALVLAAGVVMLGRAMNARGIAQSAADLAAISAASVWHSSGREPCSTASRVAQENGAIVGSCDLLPGGDVAVSTEVVVAISGLSWRAQASARAGPKR